MFGIGGAASRARVRPIGRDVAPVGPVDEAERGVGGHAAPRRDERPRRRRLNKHLSGLFCHGQRPYGGSTRLDAELAATGRPSSESFKCR